MGYRRRRRHVDPIQRLIHLIVFLAVAWFLGFAAFLAVVPLPPRYGTPIRASADAIVVLTGGAERLQEGLRLLAEHRAKELFITGVTPGITLDHILSSTALPAGLDTASPLLQCCVELGHEANNTIGNAEETALWVAERGYASIILVTANYHMTRSLLEFRTALPWITIIPYPVFPEEVLDRYWFTRPHTLWLMVNEYNKYVVALSRHLWMAIHSDQ